MRLGISEILNTASNMSDEDDRIQYMRENFTPALGTIIRYALDPNITWRLPPGKPPYRATDSVEAQGMLYGTSKKLWMFVDGVEPPSALDGLTRQNLKPQRAETLFIQYLESVDPDDARLLVAIKDKKIPYKGLTAAFFRKAYPGLLSEPNPETVKREAAKVEAKKTVVAPPKTAGQEVDIDALLAS